MRTYDVVVIGGGAAGLSGAVALARARRSVLVVDAGDPRNAPAEHVHNFLTRDGTPPGELLAAARQEVLGYGAEIVSDTVEALSRADADDPEFDVRLAGGDTVRARRLLVATGLRDVLPDIPGVAQLWGRDVLHCPYCHGWEVRDRAIGVIARDALGPHGALLWSQWSADVTLFLHDGTDPTPQEWEQLAARGVSVVDGTVAALEIADDRLTGVRLESGEIVARDAVVVAGQVHARGELLAGLGIEAQELEMMGSVIGTTIPADPNGATTVPGVWVAGNVTDMRAQVITSAASGLMTASMINFDLIGEDTRRAMIRREVRAGGR